jgi:hypothetical protein
MNSELRRKKEVKVFEKIESRSEVLKHRKMEMKFERFEDGIIERNMEGRTGGWKERKKDSKGCITSKISKVEKNKNSWKDGKKQRNIG